MKEAGKNFPASFTLDLTIHGRRAVKTLQLTSRKLSGHR